MGLPTGAGRELCRRLHLGIFGFSSFNGAADRGRQRGRVFVTLQRERTMASSFNGAADRGRQRGRMSQWITETNPKASMGLPTGAGREWLAPQGGDGAPASMGLPTGAGREAAQATRSAVRLQRGFNGAADRGRQRAASPRSATRRALRASMGLPTGAGRERSRATWRRRWSACFNGAADRGRQRGWYMPGKNAPAWTRASMGLPTGAGREEDKTVDYDAEADELQWGCRPGPAERALEACTHCDAPLRASMGLPTGAGREPRGDEWTMTGNQMLQWGCRPGPAERASDGREVKQMRTARRLQWGCRPGPAESVYPRQA